MLDNKTVIQGQWKKLSAAGEDGNVWIHKYISGTPVNVLIAHTGSVQTHGSPVGDNIPVGDAVDLDIDETYLLPHDRISDNLFADDSNDIYYATLLPQSKSVELTVDFG